MEVGRPTADLHISSAPLSQNPVSQQNFCCRLPSSWALICSGSPISSPPNILPLTPCLPSTQLWQKINSPPASEAGNLTADLHLSLRSSTPQPQVSAQLCRLPLWPLLTHAPTRLTKQVVQEHPDFLTCGKPFHHPQHISIPKSEVPIPRNTFYLGIPSAHTDEDTRRFFYRQH